MKHEYPFPSSRLLGLTTYFLHDEVVQIHSANYRTNRQLALDGNLSGEDREEYRKARDLAAWALASRLLHLTREPALVPNEHPNFF